MRNSIPTRSADKQHISLVVCDQLVSHGQRRNDMTACPPPAMRTRRLDELLPSEAGDVQTSISSMVLGGADQLAKHRRARTLKVNSLRSV